MRKKTIVNIMLAVVAILITGCDTRFKTALGANEQIQKNALVTIDGNPAGKVCRIYTSGQARIAEFTVDKSQKGLMREGTMRVRGGNTLNLKSDLATGEPLKNGAFIPTQAEMDFTVKKWSGRGLTLIGLAAIILGIAAARFLFARSIEHFLPVGLAVGLALVSAYVFHPLLLPSARRIQAKVEATGVEPIKQPNRFTHNSDTQWGKLKGHEKEFVEFVSAPTDSPRTGVFLLVFICTLPIYACLIAFTFRKLSNF